MSSFDFGFAPDRKTMVFGRFFSAVAVETGGQVLALGTSNGEWPVHS